MNNEFHDQKNAKTIASFKEFYPFYLKEHSHPMNRLLHILGSLGALLWLYFFIQKLTWWFILAGIINGYGCAWIGHFVIEKNKPATFTYPLYSFMGDWVMFFEVITFQRGLKD